jgi:hypothetical protein
MLTLVEGILLVCLVSMLVYWYRSPSPGTGKKDLEERVVALERQQKELRNAIALLVFKSNAFETQLPLTPVVYLPTAEKYRRLTRLPLTGAKRPRRGGSHGLPAALSPLWTPSTPAVWTHVACSGHLPVPFPTTLLAHTPAGWGHGGTRNRSTSRSVHT